MNKSVGSEQEIHFFDRVMPHGDVCIDCRRVRSAFGIVVDINENEMYLVRFIDGSKHWYRRDELTVILDEPNL